MNRPELVTDEDFSAYVDGELPVERQAEVAAWLAANPEAAVRVATYRAQKRELREALEPILREPVPPQLLATASPRPLNRWIRRSVAALFLLAIGASGGWYAGTATVPPAPVVEQAASLGSRIATAHALYAPEVRHPVEVTADDQPHLVYWLSKRVGTKLKPPVLTAVGFELMGGRLLPDTAGPLAQLMYQDAQGRRITFYVRSETEQGRESAFRWVKEGNVEVCFWVDGHVGYAVAGEFERRELYRLAKTIYQQING